LLSDDKVDAKDSGRHGEDAAGEHDDEAELAACGNLKRQDDLEVRRERGKRMGVSYPYREEWAEGGRRGRRTGMGISRMMVSVRRLSTKIVMRKVELCGKQFAMVLPMY
jgi:hypothetical protein